MKKIDRLLAKLLLASIALFFFSVIFSNKGKSAQKSVDSAFLNQKYKNEVAEIEISQNGEDGNKSITLKKHGEFWILSKREEQGESEISTQADEKIISSLIENAIKIHKMYIISDKVTDYHLLGLDEDVGTSIAFLKNDDSMFTKVHFGSVDSLKNRIFFRSELSRTVYECENEFQQYLTTDTSYWAKGEIISEIENPVQFSLRMNESAEFSSSKSLTLDETSAGFSSKAHALLSLRHGMIRGEKALKGAKKIAELVATSGNGRIARITFFEKESVSADEESEQSYFYTKSVVPSEIDSQETRFAFYSENAVYEISLWTYERIKNAFN